MGYISIDYLLRRSEIRLIGGFHFEILLMINFAFAKTSDRPIQRLFLRGFRSCFWPVPEHYPWKAD